MLSYEFMGYQGSNFIELSGPTLINLILVLGISLMILLALRITTRFYKHEKGRKIGYFVLKNVNLRSNWIIILIQIGYIELMLSSLVSCGAFYE